MFRLVAKWLISRSIDDDRPAPNWLRHWIDRDHELKQFELLSRQLVRRLKDDSRGRIASLPSLTGEPSARRQRHVTGHPASRRRGHRVDPSLGTLSLGALTLAACVGFLVGQLPSHRDQLERSEHEETQHIAKPPATAKIDAADREWLATTWKTSRTTLGQLRSQIRTVSGRTDVVKLSNLSAIIKPAEAAGSSAGRALATLDRSMQSQQQQLASDAKATFAFFTRRLPTSVAKLVGWPPQAD